MALKQLRELLKIGVDYRLVAARLIRNRVQG